MSKLFPGRRLSYWRVCALGLVVAVVATGATLGWNKFRDTSAAASDPPFFAGYVDVTATPYYPFEAGAAAGASVVLSFVVADPTASCQPSWGGFHSLGDTETSIDLDRRIARFRQNGGDVSVSFGGSANSELATGCTDTVKLTAAYRQVIDRYNLTTIDLDIEGEGLSDTQAGARRAAAIETLQAESRATGTELNVWLTLPVDPAGLTVEGRTAVEQMLSAGVDLAGVNLMTMDFGNSKKAAQSMLQASIASAEAAHAQLTGLYTKNKTPIGPQSLWRKIGLTPMIGQNDVTGEVFGLDDATGLSAYAQKMGVGRLSMWSLNRDASCGANYPNVTRVSDNCSGLDQGDSSFAQVLADGLTGQIDAASAAPTRRPRPTSTPVPDNPKTSPYPIWSVDATYLAEDRIVWHGYVYGAKWWTQGDLPDSVTQESDSPWKLIGPVLPGDRPAPLLVVPQGIYPAWSPDVIYNKGDRILFDGRIVESKWWNRGESPQAALDGSSTAPWRVLSEDVVAQILADR